MQWACRIRYVGWWLFEGLEVQSCIMCLKKVVIFEFNEDLRQMFKLFEWSYFSVLFLLLYTILNWLFPKHVIDIVSHKFQKLPKTHRFDKKFLIKLR